MSSSDRLRAAYLDARDDVRQAEADRSKVLTGLSHVEALFDEARRGESIADVADAVRDHLDLVAALEYNAADLDGVDLLADGPTFETHGIGTVDDVGAALETYYADENDVAIKDLETCLRDAIAGGGEATKPLTGLVDDLMAAYEDRDESRFAGYADQLVDGFEAEGVETRHDLRELLEAHRGPFYGEDLLALRSDGNHRDRAIEALADAIEDRDREGFVAARRPFARTVRALDGVAERRRADFADVTADLVDAYPENHGDAHPRLDHLTPVLLTPTRLETRFARRLDEDDEPVTDPPTYELLVRVYPDDLHVDTHEPALTDAEVEGGARFWEQVWWASHLDEDRTHEAALPDRYLAGVDLDSFPDDAERRHAAVKERAWNRLAERFGPERAAWIKREMAPSDSERLLLEPTAVTFPDGDVQASVAAFEDEMGQLRANADRRPASWTRPPRARLLPDQWIAFAEIDDDELTTTSEPVTRPLSIGPDPGSVESALETAEEFALRDGEIEWVFDFEAAEDAGMALRIELTEDQRDHGVDRLVVLGVSTGPHEVDAAGEVADLLEAHHYTDGLSLLERGTPTNDTREDAAATPPSGDDSIYERECEQPAVGVADADADGLRAARLLGIDPSTLGGDRFALDRVPGAARSLEATAAATNAALWSATWGYYVPHLLVPLDWPPGVERRSALLRWLEGFRRHFVSFVRGGGPLPPLRVGDQPYGIVPTTDFAAWTHADTLSGAPTTDVESEAGPFTYARFADRDVSEPLGEFLSALRGRWDDALEAVPRVDSGDDPALVASELLSMAGASYGFRLRDFTGGLALARLVPPSILQPDLDDAREATGDQLDAAVGVDHVPRIGDLFADEQAPVVDAPVVRDSFGATLRTLRTTRHDGLRTGLPGADLPGPADVDTFSWLLQLFFGGPSNSVAAVLCYHAILQEYRMARVRLAEHYEYWDLPLRREDVDWNETPWSLIPERQVYERDHMTMWHALEDDVPDELRTHPSYREGWTIGDMLREVPPIDRPFAELTRAFDRLERADPATVERLVRETLDLASHRYDAWATSLATRRLTGMREVAGGGLQIGAYGYVEDLRPSDDDASKGYIQAPSIDQATAAAVLRSAHDAETDEYGDLFAVDLSADRVRDARGLLAGVRAGYPLGELLGYRFERALHESEHELDKYVYPFRALAPLVAGSIDHEDDDGPDESEAVAERDVVDGVELYEMWRAGESGAEDDEGIPWGQPVGSEGIALPDPDAGDPEEVDAHGAIVDELAALEASHDAVRDVLAAESVYQLVRDSPERAGAALDALARGEAIADIEVLDTPRTGTSCTHRVVSLLDAEADESPWPASEAPRAAAEPAVEEWVGTLLGDPTRVVCRAAFRPEEGTGDWQVTTVRLSELSLSALDVVSLVEGDEVAWASELEARIGYHVQREHENVGPDHEIRLSFAPPTEWPDADSLGVDVDGAVGFGELLEVARGVRAVVTDARPVDARDLTVPGEAQDDGRVVGDLDDRARVAHERLADAAAALAPHIAVIVADEETGDRVVDDLLALVDALASISRPAIEDADATLAALDTSALEGDLAALGDAVTSAGPLVARDEDGDVVLSADEPLVEGLVSADETVQVEIDDGDGLSLTGSHTTGDDGRFTVAFDADEFEQGDEFTVTVIHESGTDVPHTGRFEVGRPAHSLRLSELAAFTDVTAGFDGIENAADGIATTREAFADDVIDDAVAALPDDAWSSQADDDLAAVRDVPIEQVPGFGAPPRWETVASVARALAAADLGADDVTAVALGSDGPSEDHLDDLVETLRDGVDVLREVLDAAARRPDGVLIDGMLEEIRDELFVPASYGIHGSVPLSVEGATRADVETLARQASSVHAEVTERLDAFDVTPDDEDAPADDPDFYVAWLEALFGDAFTVLVPFEPTNEGELAAVFGPEHSETLQNDDPMAVETWFDRVSRVRDESADFSQLLIYGEALGELSPADGPRFSVGQLPYEADDTWVGLPEAWTDEHPAGRLSVVSHVHGSLPGSDDGGDGSGGNGASGTDETYVGLFVDEFVETVPNDHQTTGLSVHYDRPANQAPNTVLLAVPPVDDDAVWSIESLAAIVRESVELAKLRTVDPEAIDGLGQLLPALAMASNESEDPAGPDTASIDLDDLLAHWSPLVEDGGEF